MQTPVNKLINHTRTSTISIADAVESAIERVDITINDLWRFLMVETRGNVENGKVHCWQEDHKSRPHGERMNAAGVKMAD